MSTKHQGLSYLFPTLLVKMQQLEGKRGQFLKFRLEESLVMSF